MTDMTRPNSPIAAAAQTAEERSRYLALGKLVGGVALALVRDENGGLFTLASYTSTPDATVARAEVVRALLDAADEIDRGNLTVAPPETHEDEQKRRDGQ
jgi:hypothetical protein